eukprot:g7962.t1
MENDNIVPNENGNEEEYQQPQEGKTIDAKEIELTNIEENVTPEDGTETRKKKKKKRYRNGSRRLKLEDIVKQLTFCNTVGLRGVMILLLILTVSAMHFLALYEYTYNFNYMKREGIWIFFMFFLLFLLLVIYLLTSWKRLTKRWIIRNYGENRNSRNISSLQNLARLYSRYFGVEKGKFFFFRLYLFEIIENWVQFYNIQTIHLCTLPLAWSMCFSFVLIAESSYRAFSLARRLWFSKEKNITVADRNIQYSIDIVIDLFFLVVPIGVIYFVYGIWTSVNETTWMLLTPSISLFGKFRRLMFEHTNQNAEALVIRNRDDFAKEVSFTTPTLTRIRSRQSLFGRDFNDKVSRLQNAQFKRKPKLIVFIASILYVVVMIVCVIFQIIALSDSNVECNSYISDDNKGYWEEGCIIKVPLCNNMFVSKCDCAVLKIVGHNMTKLSDEKFVKMTSLRNVEITRGRLNKLPDKMEELIKINRFIVSFNNIQTFDVDVLKWKYLSDLVLMFNNITKHHKNLWLHPQLVNLAINSNKGFWIPQDVNNIKLPQLIYLHMGNNSGIIPNELSSTQLPAINNMYLNGNKMENFPSKFHTFQTTIQYLGIARCGLKELQQHLESFEKLVYLDARNNSITSISPEIKQMIKDTIDFESYFSGNPACQNDKDLNCTRLCTDYCWSEKGFTNGACDETCDSRECKYDGGECKV